MDDDDNDFSFPTGLCGNFRLRPDDDDNDGAASVLHWKCLDDHKQKRKKRNQVGIIEIIVFLGSPEQLYTRRPNNALCNEDKPKTKQQ